MRVSVEPGTRQPPTVMVVEDEEVVGLFLREALHDAGFAVRSFSQAVSALDAIDDSAIVAAVIDIGLPDMMGDELARRCRARRALLPIILATGFDEHRYRDVAVADPLIRVLGKPFDGPRLVMRLEELGVYGGDRPER
jgi:DNA-binding response OmpR family regulator